MPAAPFPLRTASALVLAALGGAAHAADGNEPDLRIEVTGSNIKRTDTDGLLPLQVITRDEIERAGWTTAAELMSHVAANFNARNDRESISQGLIPGFAGANLRGIGEGYTLVLLNGRRLANYAFLGFAVDLSVIPFAALERVEILRDGASSIYGSDAIAGVINIVLKSDVDELSGSIAGGFRNASSPSGFKLAGADAIDFEARDGPWVCARQYWCGCWCARVVWSHAFH